MRGNPFRGSFASLVQDLNSIGTSKAETHRASVTHVPEKRERQRKTGKERKNKKNEEKKGIKKEGIQEEKRRKSKIVQ